jgi:two-component system sensor histidine kinase KdpD
MGESVHRMLHSPKLTAKATGVVASVLAIAVVTAAIFAFREFVPVLSLGVLYVFAVLPVAVIWGLGLSLPVAVGSMLAFNFFFLSPVHTLTLTESANWFALAVYSGTAIVVSELAARSRRRTVEAEQRRREAALLADISTDLLQGRAVRDELDQIEQRSAEVLGLTGTWIDLERTSTVVPGRAAFPLETAGRTVGRIFTPAGEQPSPGTRERFLPALAALLAVAVDRERLARQALEAEALGRSDALKTALLRAVSHDLRSPLTAISTAVSGLRNEELSLDDADREQLLETIAIEAHRLERLVANLLDLSRLQAGAAPPTQELWAVDQLVAQALDQVPEPERVEVSLQEEVPVVRVDAIQVERVLVNLIENALKFSPLGSTVGLRVNATRREVVIRVVDKGPGLPEEELERVFEPFHRADGERAGGAGLGLAIARGFAEANSGRVWAESVAGQGASFALALPVVATPARVSA